MRIGIDGREFEGERRGIGRYVWELCRELDKRLPRAEFLVYNRVPVALPVDSGRWRLRTDPTRGSRLSTLLWLKLRCGALCSRDRLDVFWGVAGFLPRLPPGVRTVVSVHDVGYRLTPETLHPLHRFAARLYFEKDLQRADAVLANSHGTAERVRQHAGRAVDGIVLPGIGDAFRRPPDDVVERRRNRYGLDAPYLLTVAAWEPRKNLETLAAAFLDLREQGYLARHRLVLVGKRSRRRMAGLADLVARDGGQGLVELGYVPDADLPALYAGADAFVLTSSYEGFGIPVLEARACGTRVVATDIPELREAGGEEAVYIPPTREGIQRGILEALGRDRPSARGSLPTWETGARTLALALAPREACDPGDACLPSAAS